MTVSFAVLTVSVCILCFILFLFDCKVFFIDHTSRTTTFIDPRLPNDLPILPSTSGTPPASPHLLLPTDAFLLPPPMARHHGASLTPPPTGTSGARSGPISPNRLLTPPSMMDDVIGSSRRRSRSVGHDELQTSARDLADSLPPPPPPPQAGASARHLGSGFHMVQVGIHFLNFFIINYNCVRILIFQYQRQTP
jgi:hypothetical protein